MSGGLPKPRVWPAPMVLPVRPQPCPHAHHAGPTQPAAAIAPRGWVAAAAPPVPLSPRLPPLPHLFAPPAVSTARIVVQGRNLEATPAIKAYCEDKVSNAIKHFEGVKEVGAARSGAASERCCPPLARCRWFSGVPPL